MGERERAGLAGLIPKPIPGLERKRAAARATLWFEQLWPALFPAVGVAGAYAVVALLNVPALLPAWPRLLLIAAVLVGMGVAAWWGLRRLVRPRAEAVDRRLERDSGLRHRPLAVLQDRPAGASAEGEQVWAMHLARVRQQVRRLRLRPPSPGLARRDGWALRGLLSVALLAALVIAGAEAPGRLWAAVAPGLPAGPASPGTVVQAWVTPPAYTGLPPVFLHAGVAAPAVPVGSHLTVSVTGGRGEPALSLDGESTEFRALDGSSWQAERDLPTAGAARLDVRRGGSLATWSLTILPDRAPMVAFSDPPGAATSGGRATLRTRMAWHADDDYGVASVQAEIRLKDRPEAPPLVIPAPLAGSPKTVGGAIVQDLTAHPWAGLPVLGRMVAKDTPGQRGESAEMAFDLPERTFRNAVAQAVILVRKQLSKAPEARQEARAALGALADRPDLFDNTLGVMLNLRTAGALLSRGRGQPAVDEAQARLWALALALEEGSTDRTARALEQARQAVRDATEAARRDPADQAAKTELEKRIEELRTAIQKHIEALTEQARRDGTEMPFDPSMPQMNARELDRLAAQAEQSAREGRMEDAQKQVAELEKLLEELQNARPEQGEQRQQRNAERRQQGRQQQDAVQDLVQREGGLLDHSRARADGSLSAARAPTEPRAQDGKAQAAMRRALGELMQRFGDLTGQIPAPLSEADTAMREAGQAMADGRDAAAGAAQQKAIEALQKGGRAMGQQLSRQFGRGQQEGEGEGGEQGDGQEMSDGDGQGGNGEDATGNRDGQSAGPRPGEAGRRRSARRDPLGRPLPEQTEGREEGTDGQALGAGTVPGDMEQARTRALQEELRRRGAERTRPPGELDYIDRLLKPF